jgi:NitT/TauT family transport system permease protein
MKGWIARIGLPLAVLAGMLAVWEFAVRAWEIPALLLPTPSRVALAAQENFPQLLSATWQTASAAVTGFAFSVLGGTLIGMLFSQSRLVRTSLFPYAICLQTVPIVAIAPVIVVWLGEGFWSVVVIATIISLFPMITNATAGMTSIPRGLQELFRLNGASRWQRLLKLQLPHSLPSLVTGAKIASGAAVLGAIVGEFFAGVGVDHPGLGYLIFVAKDRFNMAFLFAAIGASTLLGVAMFAIVSFVGQKGLLYWCEPGIDET